MTALRDEDRELLLSMYLDGELESEQVPLVEEKIRSDESWKAEYDALRKSAGSVSKVVAHNWHDIEFTDKVMARVQQIPPPTTRTAQAARRNLEDMNRTLEDERAEKARTEKRQRTLMWGVAAAATVLFAFSVGWLMSGRTDAPESARQRKATPSTIVATYEAQPGLFRRDAAQSLPEGQLADGDTLACTAAVGKLNWSDGSEVWLKQDAAIIGHSIRSLALKDGAMLVKVAPRRKGEQSFAVHLADGSIVEALGTRFELAVADGGTRVRVVEGKVRRSKSDQSPEQGIVARGGEEITADFQVRPFDPRAVALAWASEADTASAATVELARAPQGIAPWPQAGGSPGHSGVTPCQGPVGLAARTFYAFPRGQDHTVTPGEALEPQLQLSPAVVGVDQRVYILRRAGEAGSVLMMLDLTAKRPAWQTCGEPLPGHSQHGPVITPTGLVVAGTTGKIVQAWDPENDKTAWRKNVGSSVFALTAAYDGTLLASTFQRLVALDGAGEERWTYNGLNDLQAPACVLTDGTVLAVSRAGQVAALDWQGHPRWHKKIAGEGVFGPPVEQVDGGVWVRAAKGVYRLQPQGELQDFNPDATPGAWPLGSGVWSAAQKIRLAGDREVVLPLDGPIAALAADGSGYIYAALKNTVYRFKREAPGRPEFSAAKQGEILPGGIAVVPGRLIVTTTHGVQVYE